MLASQVCGKSCIAHNHSLVAFMLQGWIAQYSYAVRVNEFHQRNFTIAAKDY
jgi:hypothetical protein